MTDDLEVKAITEDRARLRTQNAERIEDLLALRAELTSLRTKIEKLTKLAAYWQEPCPDTSEYPSLWASGRLKEAADEIEEILKG